MPRGYRGAIFTARQRFTSIGPPGRKRRNFEVREPPLTLRQEKQYLLHPILAFFGFLAFFVLRFPLLFCASFPSFPKIFGFPRRGKPLLFWGNPCFFSKKARVGGSGSIRVRNSGAGSGCAKFMDAWNKCVLSAGKPMSIKFLVLGGVGGYFGFGGVPILLLWA